MTDLEIMQAYLMLKVRQGDWHGVADAAMDIRDTIFPSLLHILNLVVHPF